MKFKMFLLAILFSGTATAQLPDREHAKLIQPAAAPNYPIAAARDRVEGKVIVGYDVTSEGKTTNIMIIKAFPYRRFDREAVKAISQWKFEPKVVNGKAVADQGLTATLDFKLNNEEEQ